METVVQRATPGVVGAVDGFPAGIVWDGSFADRSATDRQPGKRRDRSFYSDRSFHLVSRRRVHDGRFSLGHARDYV